MFGEVPIGALDSPTELVLRSKLRMRFDHHRATASVALKDVDARHLWHSLGGAFTEAGLAEAREAGDLTQFWTAMSLVSQELGAVVADVPFLSSAILSSTIAYVAGDRHLAAKLANGQSTAAWLGAHTELPHPSSVTGRLDRNRLWAKVCDVAGADHADLLVGLHGDTLFTVRAGQASFGPSATADTTRTLADISLAGAAVEVLCDGPRAIRAVTMAAHAVATMLAVEMHSRAVSCARPPGLLDSRDLAEMMQRAWSAAQYAVMCLAADDPYTGIAAQTAVVLCATFARTVLRRNGHEPCGSEFVSHAVLLERLSLDVLAWGSPAATRRRLAAMLADAGPDAEHLL